MLWLIILTVLHCLPGDEIPTGGLFNIPQLDKVVHFCLFMILVILSCRVIDRTAINPSRLKKIYLTIAISGLLYGIAMEFVQYYFIINRTFDIADMAADAVGSYGGFLFATKRYIKK